MIIEKKNKKKPQTLNRTIWKKKEPLICFYYLLRFKKTDDKGHLKELYKGFPLLITVFLILIIYNLFVDNSQWYHLCDTRKSAVETYLIIFTTTTKIAKKKRGQYPSSIERPIR